MTVRRPHTGAFAIDPEESMKGATEKLGDFTLNRSNNRSNENLEWN
ncbi:MAG TPA: hypothetical protein VFF49_05960 [Thermodesulfobacteriota bacterium]|nr:hypothetical protein [Thermodesulfobacteriota bacterium]